MKQYLAFLVFILVASSCRKESLQNASRQLQVNNFTKVSVGGNFKVNVVKGAVFSVKVEGRTEDIDAINTVVREQELLIEYKNLQTLHELVTITVTMPSLNGFRFYNTAKANVSGFQETSTIGGTVSQYSNAVVHVSAPGLKVDVLDHAELSLIGNTEQLEVRSDNQSVIHAFQMLSVYVRAIAVKNSLIRVHASNTIHASASKNSIIYFKGNPGNRFLAELENSNIIEEW
ncbi:MAG TPA: DUF2807 domain-containing protein [Lacibacter sp.]|nr:DUF2807 domain-containing protein [Lacibacter sp.]